MSAVIEERVLEIEQGTIVSGAPVFSSSIMPTWFDSRTGRAIASKDDVQLPIGFKWTSEWQVLREASQAIDRDGWIVNGNTRKRIWIRRREKMTSGSTTSGAQRAGNGTATSSSYGMNSQRTSLSTAAPSMQQPPKDEATTLRMASESLQRLDAAVQRMSYANDRSSIEQFMKEGRDAIATAEFLLAQLETSEKPTIRAGRLKLGNDLLKNTKRFEAVVSETFARSGRTSARSAPVGGAPARGQVLTPTYSVVDREAEEAAARARQESFDRREAQLKMQEREHRKILSNEIDVTVQDIEGRHQELIKMSKDAQDLKNMMDHLASMVNDQGQTVEAIAKQTQTARDTVDKGLNEVKKADQYQQEGGCIIS